MTWDTFKDYCASGNTVPGMSKSHFGAYRAGVKARDEEKGSEACPYRDKIGHQYSKTPRAYAFAWLAGWSDRDKELR